MQLGRNGSGSSARIAICLAPSRRRRFAPILATKGFIIAYRRDLLRIRLPPSGSAPSSNSAASGASLPDEAATPCWKAPRAVILGCAGEQLSADERRFFGAADPVGFILFRRNCRSPDQVRELVAALRGSVGRSDAPILIHQEGGRAACLRPPSWRVYPSAARLGSLPDPHAEVAVRLGARLIADDLRYLGITVDCLRVLDVPVDGADPVIGDRAYGSEPG